MAVASGFVELLYGSKARGDADASSDDDYVVISDAPPAAEIRAAEASWYTWEEFEGMAEYGSLFLRHLRDEAVLARADHLGRQRLRSIMLNLPPYTRAGSDLESFFLAIEDCQGALMMRDSSPSFELACLATTARHASIVGCYLLGEPTFGRYKSIRRVVELLGLPAEIADDFPGLYRFKLALAGRDNVAIESGSWAEVEVWIGRVRSVVLEVSRCLVSSSV